MVTTKLDAALTEEVIDLIDEIDPGTRGRCYGCAVVHPPIGNRKTGYCAPVTFQLEVEADETGCVAVSDAVAAACLASDRELSQALSAALRSVVEAEPSPTPVVDDVIKKEKA